MKFFTLLVLSFIIISPFLLIRFFVKKIREKRENKGIEKSDTINYTLEFPDPQITNEYRFYKFLEETSTNVIENWYNEAKKRNFHIPKNYHSAIEHKIRYGEFKNPHQFSTFFAPKFDVISIYHVPPSYIENKYNELRFCFIQNDQIASVETFDIGAPLSVEVEEDSSTTFRHFEAYWHAFGLDKYLNNNLLVFRQQDFHYFYPLIEKSNFQYNLKFIIIEEVLRDKNLYNHSFETAYKKSFPKKSYDKNNPYQLVELVYELIDEDISELTPYFHKLGNSNKAD